MLFRSDVVVNDEFGDTSALLVAVESDSRSYRELDKYCELIGDRLRQLPSVSNVRVLGNLKEQIVINVDYSRLSEYGISPQVIIDVLSGQGITTVSGPASFRAVKTGRPDIYTAKILKKLFRHTKV